MNITTTSDKFGDSPTQTIQADRAVVVQRNDYTDLQYSMLEKLHEVASNLAVLTQEMKHMAEAQNLHADHGDRLIKVESKVEALNIVALDAKETSDRLTTIETKIEGQEKAIAQKITLGAVFAALLGILVPILHAHWK